MKSAKAPNRAAGLLAETLRHIAHTLRDKINIRGTIREIRDAARRYGWRFGVAAGVWEFLESFVIPAYLSWHHLYVLAAFFVLFHFEPVVWPIFFYCFRTWDRILGRIPWEPDRSAMSASWRSGAKVSLYRLATVGLFWVALSHLNLSQGMLALYTLVMTLFSYVHERLWHDSGWGITPEDRVLPKRVVAKALTYRAVSGLVMLMALKAILGSVPWGSALAYQGASLAIHLGLETIWSRSTWGIVPTPAAKITPAT